VKRSHVHAVSALCAAGYVALSLLAMAFVPASAVAGAYKCDSRSLYEDDEDRLRDAAEEVPPKSAHISTVAPCRYLTSAHAWIETRKVTSRGGPAVVANDVQAGCTQMQVRSAGIQTAL